MTGDIHPSSNYMIFMGTWISNSINNNIIIIYFLFHQFSYLLVWQDIFYIFIIQTYISDEENGPNHLVLAMLPTFGWQHCQWYCPKNFFGLKLHNVTRNARKFLEAMPLAMLPTKSLQHCQDQMIPAISVRLHKIPLARVLHHSFYY